LITVVDSDDDTSTAPLRTPRSEPGDSDGVLLALETARALEEQGELREAARWIRRAANEAEQNGNDARVLLLARAAADLTNAIEFAKAAVEPTARSSLSTIPPSGSTDSTIPPPVSLPAMSPPFSYVNEIASSVRGAFTGAMTRVGAIRVALRGSMGHDSFVVERLEPGEPCPAGAKEAILVFSGEIEGSVELTTHLHALDGSNKS
jgi:hypothetical protein